MSKKKEGNVINQIWMAGIGVVKTAQEEGVKMIRSFIEKGEEFHVKSKDVTESSIHKASSILQGGVGSVRGKIDDIVASPHVGLFDKLGLEDALSAVFKKIGIPTKKELDILTRKIERLSSSVKEIRSSMKE